MIHTHRLPYYITQLQRTYQHSLFSYLSAVRQLQSQNIRLAAFLQNLRMLSQDQSTKVKVTPLKEADNMTPVASDNSKRKSKKKRRKQKLREGHGDKLLAPSDEFCSPVIYRVPNGDFITSTDRQDMAIPLQDTGVVEPRSTRVQEAINSPVSNITELRTLFGNNMTPNQEFLSQFTLSTANVVPAVSSPPKSTKPASGRRGIHNEATPNKSGLPKMNCSEYWPLARVEEGIENGSVVTGSFRINQRTYTKAYITAHGGERDILIEGIDRRNRAMHGDVVAVELINEDNHAKKEVADIARKLAVEFGNMQITEERLKHDSQQLGRVVRILEKKHCRKAAGILKQYCHNAYGFALFSPQDSRMPRIMISLSECPEEFVSRPQDFQNILYIAEITNWKATCAMASGKLVKQLGESGEIEPETEGYLMEYNIDDGPFPEEALACLPHDLPWTVPQEEYAKRKDLRRECVFTIDPSTARDLDDALSVKLKGDGNFEVGVHIADVSYFIDEGNALDSVASRRATSVYLVQRVVPMLPRLLCEQLCSLNPGDDKLTYSVVWTITPEGKILDEWFGRTVIRSCTKLSYEHAQQLITTEDPDTLDPTQFPEINGSHGIADVHECVRHLYQLSVLLRRKRFDSGALSLNQPKMTFNLDKETRQPTGFGSYVARDSNRLVEEFMLLANMAVAHRLVRALPEHAILRRHPAPHPKMIEDLLALCKRCGVGIDAGTSQTLHNSLEKLKDFNSSEKEALYYAVISLCSKPMQLAKYFCAGALDDQTLYHHYALNVPLYTHFTSPIRRYPDIMVHRMLTVALGDEVNVAKSVQQLQSLAEECNDKKASAKKVQELSNELFFSIYIRHLGELHEEAVIVGLLDSAIDVLLLHSGLVKRIYCNSLPLHQWKADKEQKDRMTLYWKDEEELGMTENETLNGKEATNGTDASGTLNGNKTPGGTASQESHATEATISKRTPKSSGASNAKKSSKRDSNPDRKSNGQLNKIDDTEGEEPRGQQQIVHIFDKIDVILKSEEDKGLYKIKVYIPKPEKE